VGALGVAAAASPATRTDGDERRRFPIRDFRPGQGRFLSAEGVP
jgi:hypothetical protein